MTVGTDLDVRRREAAAWFARLNKKRVAATDITAFSQWRRAPENAEAYARIETLWDAAATLAGDPDIAALTEGARARADASRKAQSRLSKVLIPIGALAGVGLVVLGAMMWSGRGQTYQTVLGEHRTFALEDGSNITLDTASRVRVTFSANRRSVELVSGQALFAVHGDPTRPFIVTAGHTDVTAVGTRFDVRRSGDGARVTLIEGKVEVRDKSEATPHWRLAPGQQILTAASRPTVTMVDTASATSWTTGRLLFTGESVGAAIAEVNRYSAEKIVLEAPAVSRVNVSGAFNTGDVDGFVSALTELYPLKADRSQAGQIILRDPSPK